MTKWQPIETATRNRVPILGYDGGEIRIIHFWNNGKTWVIIDSNGIPFEPTHWMPLPESPK